MQYVWEEKDIKVGVMFHRGDSREGCSDKGQYAASCLAKLGYRASADEERIYFVTEMSDGKVWELGNAAAVVEHLNDGGYRPTTPKELKYLIDNQAGFFRLYQR